MKTALFLALSLVSTAQAFDVTSTKCASSIQVERSGELRRFSFCKDAKNAATCEALGERKWYTVSDLNSERRRLYGRSALTALFTVASGATTVTSAIATPVTAGASLIVAAPAAASTGVNAVIMVQSWNGASALSSEIIADEAVSTEKNCIAIQKMSKRLEAALNEIK